MEKHFNANNIQKNILLMANEALDILGKDKINE